jgi:hypothetical protein
MIALAALAVSVAAFVAPTAAQATPVSPDKASAAMTAKQLKIRSNTIHQALFAMGRAGMSNDQIAQSLWSRYQVRMVTKAAPNAGGTAFSTTNAYLTLPTPSIAYDTQAHIYYAVAYWSFNSNAIGELMSEAGYCFGCNHGGYDGFGMTFNHAVTISGEDATSWGRTSCGYYGTSQVPLSRNDSAGDVFEKQDRSNFSVCNSPAGDYNMYNGEAVTDLTAASVTCPLNVRSVYAHTWSSASITGASISYNSITFNISNSFNSWQRTSGAGIYC